MRHLNFKSFLDNDNQDRISLHTIKGKIGYQIVKFELMGPDGNTNVEQVVKIYKNKQTANTTDIRFSDPTLLAAAILNDTNDPHYLPAVVVIFHHEIINQDIYITNKGHDNLSGINYSIELKEISLSDTEAMVATLKDMKVHSAPS